MTKFHLSTDGETLVGDFFNNGAYGDLFKIYNGKRLLKVFRRRENQYENFIVENACRSEMLAYTRLTSDAELCKKAPRYYGAINIKAVYQGENDITDRYILNSAYSIEFIDGHFQKVGFNTEAKEEVAKFCQVGVDYIEDADFCITDTGFMFIDFAVLGAREEIERIEYYGLSFEEKFNLFYKRVPFLAPEPSERQDHLSIC